MKIKTTVALLLALVALLSFVGCADDAVPDGMKNVAPDTAMFYLYVPESWISQSESGIAGAVSPLAEGCNVNVTVYLLDEYIDIPKYFAERCMPEYEATFTNLVLDDTLCVEGTLGGVDARTYVFSASLGGEDYRFRQVIAMLDNVVYTLTYTAPAEHYDTYTEDVDQICANFVFR